MKKKNEQTNKQTKLTNFPQSFQFNGKNSKHDKLVIILMLEAGKFNG